MQSQSLIEFLELEELQRLTVELEKMQADLNRKDKKIRELTVNSKAHEEELDHAKQVIQELQKVRSEAVSEHEEQALRRKELQNELQRRTIELESLQTQLYEKPDQTPRLPENNKALEELEHAKKMIQELKEACSKAADDYEEQFAVCNNLKIELERRTAAVGIVQTELQELQQVHAKAISDYEEQSVNSNKLQDELRSCTTQIITLKTALENLQSQFIEKSDQVHQLTVNNQGLEELEHAKKIIQELQEVRSKAVDDYEVQSATCHNLKSELERRTTEFESLQAELIGKNDQIRQLTEKNEVREEALAQVKETIQELQQAHAKAMSDYEEQSLTSSRLQSELKRCSAQIAALMSELKNLQSEKSDEVRQLTSDSQAHVEELDRAKKLIQELQEARYKAVEDYEELSAACNNLKGELQRRSADLEQVRAELIEKDDQIRLLTEKDDVRREAHAQVERALQELQQAHANTINDYEEQTVHSSRLQSELKSCTAQASEVKAVMEELREEQKRQQEMIDQLSQEKAKIAADAERAWKLCDEADDLEDQYKQKLVVLVEENRMLKEKCGLISNSACLLPEKSFPRQNRDESQMFSGEEELRESTAQTSSPPIDKTTLLLQEKSPIRQNASCRQQ